MQNNHQQQQLLSTTTSTRYTVGDNITPPKTTMTKKNKQHRKSKSPQHTRPPDSQEIEQSQAEHVRAIEINQQHIKNKRKNAHSIIEYTQPLPKTSQKHLEESDLHLDHLSNEDAPTGNLPNMDGWEYPMTRYDGKAAAVELKRKESQLTQDIEQSVNRNLHVNSFAALDTNKYDSSSSHSSASKKQKTVPTSQFEDNQEDSSIIHTDKEGGKQYKDGSYEQIVYNNPNTNLTLVEIVHLLEEEIKARNDMAMGENHDQQKYDELARARIDTENSNEDGDWNDDTLEDNDTNKSDKEAEEKQENDIQLFNNIAKAKLLAAKKQHQHLKTTQQKHPPPNQEANNTQTPTTTYAAATYNTPSTLPQIHNPYITSPRDISLCNRHLDQAIDAYC
jgi:hypothetical protein